LGNTNDEWIKLHQKTVQRRAYVNKAMTIWAPKINEIYWARWKLLSSFWDLTSFSFV